MLTPSPPPSPLTPARSWTAAVRVAIWLGCDGIKDVSIQRKILQTNVGALLGILFVLIFMTAYQASEHAGVQLATWVILPGLPLFTLPLWLNHRHHHHAARHALMTISTGLIVGVLYVQGTLINSQHYLLLYLLMGPLIFEYRHWRSILLWAAIELTLFALSAQGVFQPMPEFVHKLSPELQHRLIFLVEASMVVGLFGVMMASEVASVRNEKTQQRLAETDTLTGAPNRRAFEAALDDTLTAQRIPRADGSLPGMALLLLDIDHFKRINDDLGHDQGDVILREVVAVLHQQVRRGDTLARVGGEEFALLLSNITSREAQASAQRLCDSIRRHPFRTRDGVRDVTLSVGLVYFENPMLPEDLYTLADQALYEAKKSGRDRVVRLNTLINSALDHQQTEAA